MKVLIAGGGTGGHVYPALSIAAAIQQKNPNANIQFVGTPRGIESRVIPEQGYKLHLLNVGRLNSNVSLGERIKTVLQLPLSLIQACVLIFKFRPSIVIGVGGYASGPALVAAKMFKIPTCIWEPNAYPGMANRWLSKFVDHAIVVFKESANFLKLKDVHIVPMPVRAEIEAAPVRIPKTSDFCVLVFGGSQGARAINNVVSEAICSGHPKLKSVRFVHQTGKADFEKLNDLYKKSANATGKVDCLEYLNNMPERYNWADLVVARSGTGTLSELAAMGKASILIPLPSAADDHQTKNAKVLADAGAALLIPQKDFTVQSFISAIEKLEKNSEEIQQMEVEVKKFFKAKSAQLIAEKIINWAKS